MNPSKATSPWIVEPHSTKKSVAVGHFEGTYIFENGAPVGSKLVAEVFGDNHKERASLICLSVNTHERAKAVLRDLLDQVNSLEGYELTRDIDTYKAQANFDDAIQRAEAMLIEIEG